MRVGIYTEIYKPVLNGVVTSVESFRTQLEALGHEVFIYTPGYMDYADDHVLPFHSMPLPTRTPYRMTLPLRKPGPWPRLDVVHAQSPFAMGMLGWRHARRERIPLIFTYHTRLVDYSHYLPLGSFITKPFLVWVSRTFGNMANWVVVPSRPIEVLLRGYGVRSPIDVVPTNVQLAARAAADPHLARERHLIPPHRRILLNVGRLAREKNMDVLLESFALAAPEDTHLLLVGDGPLRAHLQARAITLGVSERVTFTGFVPHAQVAEYYAAADLFVFTSLTETQGLVLEEALQTGLPVLAVAEGGVIDVLSRRRGGIGVEPARPLMEVYASALRDLLSGDALARLAQEARTMQPAVDEASSVRRLLAVYEAAIASRPRPRSALATTA